MILRQAVNFSVHFAAGIALGAVLVLLLNRRNGSSPVSIPSGAGFKPAAEEGLSAATE